MIEFGRESIGSHDRSIARCCKCREFKVHFVDVGDGVKIEVLDWGWNGTPVVLLAGSGNTGHVYEDLHPSSVSAVMFTQLPAQLRRIEQARARILGSRVGHGCSPDHRCAKITKPILVGHSMAGSKSHTSAKWSLMNSADWCTWILTPTRLDHPWSNEEYRTLVMKSMKDGAVGPPKRTDADNASVQAYQEYQKRSGMFPSPAGEIRSQYEIAADGRVGKYRTPSYVSQAIDAGSIPRDYRRITVPVLAFFPFPGILKASGRISHLKATRSGWTLTGSTPFSSSSFTVGRIV